MPVSEQRTRADQRTTLTWLAFLLLIALAVAISAALMSRLPGDLLLTRWVQSLATPWLDDVMEAVTTLSGRLVSVLTITVLAAGLVLVRRWQEGAAFLGIFALNGLLAGIKWVVDRPRPSEELVRVLESGTSSSFPSGHAYHAVVFGGLLLVFLVVRIRPVWLRRSVTVLLVGFIVLSGVSRVYLGAHWPSDVLGSVALGIPSVALLSYLCRRLKRAGMKGL